MVFTCKCIDALSPYCPCYLAETQNCLVCSVLQGKDTCDCNWQGFCIYQEYIWNGKKKKNFRKTVEAKIAEKKAFSDNLVVFKVILTLPALSRDFSQPGTYVFLKSFDSPTYFEVPICVMDANEDENSLSFAVQIIGPKTKSLVQENTAFLLRGPYYNGVLGLKYIKGAKNKKCLLIGGGIGQASLVLIAKALVRGKNEITALLDSGAINYNPAEDYLKNLDVAIRLFAKQDLVLGDLLLNLIEEKNIEMIYSGGSDMQHDFVKSAIVRSGRKIDFAVSNNVQMCCGEGICGSCVVVLGSEKIKFCKAQTEYMI
ncbi:NAD(P)H-flavin reductase [Caldanaerovirga acetigignens]|uniref:NAD(P)H-flavin reductase n=1 Tax=Caldanaerovirga acetigignens TaxID=447595 RepID=A0A1M7L9A4_9FIRM|nr:NAD(P)H-flavin reductase [Caldanaerovirga acetigignens]